MCDMNLACKRRICVKVETLGFSAPCAHSNFSCEVLFSAKETILSHSLCFHSFHTIHRKLSIKTKGKCNDEI